MGTRGRSRWQAVVIVCAVGLMVASAAASPRAPAATGGQSPGLRAGVGFGDLTPPVGTPMFAYTAREAVVSGVVPFLDQDQFDTNLHAKTFIASVGVHTRVRARALVLEQDAAKVALVQVDLGALPYDLHQAVAARIAHTGITRDNLLVAATHTHGSVGPIWPLTHSAYGILGGDAFDPRIFGLVADGIAGAVVEADAALAPARAGTARVEVFDATRNRNLVPHLANRDEPHDASRADDLPHSIPAELSVLRVDLADGTPLGLFSVFAIHGTSFGDSMLHFTGDNQAFSTRLVEDAIREEAGLGAEAVVVHAQVNGAEGDISPRGSTSHLGDLPGGIPPAEPDEADARFYAVGEFAGAELAGRRVARAALEAWRAAGDALRPDVEVDARFTLLPLAGQVVDGEPVGLTVALGCAGVVCPDGTASPVDLPGQGAKLPLLAGPPGSLVPAFAPLQALRIGDQLLVTTPFEVTKQMGTRIEDGAGSAAAAHGFDVAGVAVVGLANGYGSYLATPEEYDTHHYEGSFTLYGRQQGPYVQAGLSELVAALAAGETAPAGAAEPPVLDLSLPPTPPLTPEPSPGLVVRQPRDVDRFEQATFTWQGGDPAADDPHVRVEIRDHDTWRLVTTDDSYEDLVTHAGSGPHRWTERWEPDRCTASGTHRFVVRGRTGAGPYRVASAPFEVDPSRGIVADPPVVEDGVVHFRATYEPPDPRPVPLRARPRLVTSGRAAVEIAGTPIVAGYEPARHRFEATGDWRAGTPARVLAVEDDCGNGQAVTPAEGPVGEGPTADAPRPGRLPATGTPGLIGAGVTAGLVAVAIMLVIRATPAPADRPRRRARRSGPRR